MTETRMVLEDAQEGLRRIEIAILRLLGSNPEGLRNSEIAEKLNLRSDFNGKQKDYLTYSVLGGLLRREEICCDHRTKLFSKAR
jgi:uncharacterized protein